MNIKLPVIILSAFLIFSLPKGASANLIYNGDFEINGEQGYTTGWTSEWNNNIFGTDDNPYSGTHAARNFYDGGMYQDVPVAPGVVYSFRGFLYVPSGGDSTGWGSYLGFYWMDAQDNLVGTWGMQWDLDLQYNFRNFYLVADSRYLDDPITWMTAPQDAVKARVRFGTWQNDVIPANPTDFDNFDFSPVPEPLSLLLVGFGLAGLIFPSMRRR